MTKFQFFNGDCHVSFLNLCAIVAPTAFMLTACDHGQRGQSVPDPTVDNTLISEAECAAPINESATDLTARDLSDLNRQSQEGSSIASNVLAQEAERLKDYRKAAHFQSLALMQGSIDEHLAMANLFAEVAERHSTGSNRNDFCILWERAIWHTEYVIEHAEDKSGNEILANDNQEAAKLWRAEFRSKMQALGVEEKCQMIQDTP